MAGNNIKGITVEINGNTAPLDKALKGVNKSSYDLKQELKQVEKALKLDPKNTVLLQQKQELLAKSITNTKEKLGTLKAAEEQAQAKFAQGKISEDQYRALQREVINTEQELKRLALQYANVGTAASRSIVAAGDSIKKVGDGVTNVGKKVSVASAAVTGLGTAAVASYKTVKVGMDEVIKATGATGQAAKELEVTYKNIGRNSTADFATIGQALGEVNTRFNLTGKAAEDCTLQFLKFAKINNMDAKTSVALVSRAMGDAGIKATDYSRVLDMLTVAAQKSGIGIEGLTTDLAKYGAPMRALGFDTETSIAMFSAWEKAGVTTELAFGGMKKSISNWGAAGKDSAKEFSKTLEAIKKAPNIAKATTMAIDVFGQKAGPDLADAIRGGRFEVQEYVDALKKSGGSVTNTTNQMANGTGVITKATHAAQIAAAEFGDTIVKALIPIITSITSKIKAASTYLNGLDEGTRKKIVMIGMMIAILGPLIIIIGTLISSIGSIVAGVGAVVGAFSAGGIAIKAMGAAFKFMTGPIGITILIITALVAGFIYLWKNCEGFRNFWKSLWEGIKNTTKIVVDALVGFFTVTIPGAWNSLVGFFTGIPAWFSGLWTSVGTATTNAWNNIKTSISNVLNSIKEVLSSVWGAIVAVVMAILAPFIQGVINIFNSMKSGISTVFEGLKLYFTGIWNVIKNIFLGAILLIIDLVTGNFGKMKTDAIGILNNLKAAFAQIWAGIKLIFTGVITAIVGFCKTMWTGMVNTSKIIFNGLKTFMSGLWNGIKNTAISAWNALKTGVINICNGIKSGVISLFNGILNFFRNLPGTLKTLGINAFNGLKNGITSVLSTLGGVVKSGFTTAIDFIKNLPAQMLQWGKDFIQGFINGVGNMVGAVVDKVKGVANKISSTVRETLGIHSPSKVMYEIGKFVDEGLANGIEDGSNKPAEAAKKVADLVSKEIKKIKDTTAVAIKDLNTQFDKLSMSETIALRGANSNKKNAIKDEYDAKKKAVKQQIELRKEQADKEITEIQRIGKINKETLEKELADKKAFVDKVNTLNDQIKNALKEKYTKEEKGKEESIQKQIDDLGNLKESNLKNIEETYNSKKEFMEADEKKTEESIRVEIDILDKWKESATKIMDDAYKLKKETLEKSKIDSEKAFEAEQSNLDKWKESQIKSVEEVSSVKIKVLQLQMDSLDEQTKTEERADKDKEELDKINNLKGAISFEHNDFNKTGMQDEVDKLQAERDKRLHAQITVDKKEDLKKQMDAIKATADEQKNSVTGQYELQKESLKNRIDDSKDYYSKEKEMLDKSEETEKESVKSTYEAKKEILQNKLEDSKKYYLNEKKELDNNYNSTKEVFNKQYADSKDILDKKLKDVKKFYEDKLKEANLEAEAEKLVMDNNQKGIIELLNSYGDQYKLTGQTLGDRLAEGFKPAIDNIRSMIANITAGISQANDEAVSTLQTVNANAVASSAKINSSGNSSSSSSTTSTKNEYNVAITSPMAQTPSQQRRDMESTLRKLIFA
ncbi:MAG: phage tail tape measure protein [Clostridium sp.]|uniref:phage tail tape measure protein n=1 Tax=Clostridium sp. TaxID=1506 RepID=UPI003D6C70F9